MGGCCCRCNDEKIYSNSQYSEEMKKPNQINTRVLDSSVGSVVSQGFSEMGSYMKIKAHQREEKGKKKKSSKTLRSQKDPQFEINYRAGSVNPGSQLSYEARCPSKAVYFNPSQYLNFCHLRMKSDKLLSKLEERSHSSAEAEMLNIASNGLDTEEIVKALSLFPGLTGYCLAKNEINSLAEIAKRLKNTRVRSLALGGNPLNTGAVLSFGGVVKYLGIKQLGLAGLMLGDIRAKHFIENIKDANLSSLDLSYNNISNQGFEAICQVGFEGQCLFLCGNTITLESLCIFAESLEVFPRLRNLDLRGNPITSSSNSLRHLLSKTTAKGITLFLDSLSVGEIRLMSAMHLFVSQGPELVIRQQIYYPFYI